MWSWFGGAAAQKRKDAPKNAILLLREQLDMLQKREKHLENQIATQDAEARKFVNTNKNAAKAALRRKKVHEKNCEQTTAQIVQLEQQIYSIEAANINHETLQAMKQAGAAMSQIHGGMSIDQVDETMEILREQHHLSEEIGAAITSVPLGEQPDEDELETELEGLEQEAMDERMLNTGPVPVNSQLDRLPEAGKSELAGKTPAQPMAEEDDEEAELAKLRAEMAM
ncbi:Snf7 [Penicillium atrosanguineum]|uniref:Vacuolar-sorting protein SNF7 n=1 Tax=Penicillium atrosanguineum TaxID=1132637 RepID=A0A9W9U429_9EURO|nr:Snf7 [Penicillium atrosanguineum]KAJ5122639.1 Snf7 [Penicillium atrosanguineum]KAJ5140366.1 Snf7 [Penicillium atrosanguineum]KAJ5310280.1 Snf7 [Penicillium atrosanguineum]KAJ5315797.1 Snf7 [Penicillium atrosanguineum]